MSPLLSHSSENHSSSRTSPDTSRHEANGSFPLRSAATVALHLVRHAHAGDRTRFDGDDLERPLSEKGHEQAERLVAHFADLPIRGVWSSIAVRCQQTVYPLAVAHELVVEPIRLLTEGARPIELLEALREEANGEGDLVLCSHGDLIPDALNRLLREGMSVVGPRGCEKGSVWSLETRGRDIVRGVYTARP